MTTQLEVAAHLDLTTRHVRDLQGAGVIPRGANLDAARLGYIRHLREMAAGRATNSSDLSLTTERALLARVQREKTELEIAQKRGELVSLADAERGWSALVGAFRSVMLTLPERAALDVQGKSESDVEQILTDMVYEALTELSNWKPDDDDE
jgi:phage terminase Nu1 subunit (DNA packaging protein)